LTVAAIRAERSRRCHGMLWRYRMRALMSAHRGSPGLCADQARPNSKAGPDRDDRIAPVAMHKRGHLARSRRRRAPVSRVCTSAPVSPVGLKAAASARRPPPQSCGRRHGSARADLGESTSDGADARTPGGAAAFTRLQQRAVTSDRIDSCSRSAFGGRS
jgi:hypothetical protein